MPRDGERPECSEVASILEGKETEWDEDEEDGFLVDVPAEEEGAVATEG